MDRLTPEAEPRRSPPWVPLLAVLTLGLAPFTPEPHVVEKLRMLVVDLGAGMRPIDAFDLLLHGAPWVWLAYATAAWLRGRVRRPAPPP